MVCRYCSHSGRRADRRGHTPLLQDRGERGGKMEEISTFQEGESEGRERERPYK